MFVATVTLPAWPARATIWASLATSLAFRTWCGVPRSDNNRDKCFGLVDGSSADQDGPPLLVQFQDFVGDRVPFGIGRTENPRGQPPPLDGLVRRNGDHSHLVDLAELAGRSASRAGHARQIAVTEEQVLDGNAGGLPGRNCDFDLLLGLDRLVNPIPPLAAFRQPSGELVDDHDFPVADDVLPIQVVIAVYPNRPLHVLVQIHQAHGAAAVPAGAENAGTGGQPASVRPSWCRARNRSARLLRISVRARRPTGTWPRPARVPCRPASR